MLVHSISVKKSSKMIKNDTRDEKNNCFGSSWACFHHKIGLVVWMCSDQLLNPKASNCNCSCSCYQLGLGWVAVFLQLLQLDLTRLTPCELLSITAHACQRCSEDGNVFKELAQVLNHSIELLDVIEVSWPAPVKDFVNFQIINVNSFVSHNKSKTVRLDRIYVDFSRIPAEE